MSILVFEEICLTQGFDAKCPTDLYETLIVSQGLSRTNFADALKLNLHSLVFYYFIASFVGMHRLFVFLFVLLLTTPTFTQDGKSDILDQFIQNGIAQWKVPGLAAAVVHEGEVKFIKTYGQRNLDQSGEVDLQTTGMMGSTTKAVTALALALLVEDTLLGWNDKVHEILPDFILADPYVQKELTIIDLLTHRAGLGNTDMLWFSGLQSEETLERMRYAQPAYSFRADYTYQNVMYLAAGAVIEEVSGLTWEEFVRQRIFQPLGMQHAVPKAIEAQVRGNFLSPHHVIRDTVRPIPQVTAGQVAPAGDIWASIEDMSIWMQFLLDSTKVNGVRLLSKENFNILFQPHTIIPRAKFYPTSKLTRPTWTTYGLGWFQQDYQGRSLQFHTGSLPGLVAILGLLPSENFGVYVFANLDHAELRHAIMLKSIDLFIDDDNHRDWNAEVFNLYQSAKETAKLEKAKKDALRIPHTTPRHELEFYSGVYRSTLYGDVVVDFSSASSLRFNTALSSTLEHWHHDTFRYRWTPYSDPGLLTFEFDENGLLTHLQLMGEKFMKVKASAD